jgi:hypothetical protein
VTLPGPASQTPGEAADEIPLRWSDFVVRVLPSEIVDAAEAAKLFLAYYETGEAAEGYVTRARDPQSTGRLPHRK